MIATSSPSASVSQLEKACRAYAFRGEYDFMVVTIPLATGGGTSQGYLVIVSRLHVPSRLEIVGSILKIIFSLNEGLSVFSRRFAEDSCSSGDVWSRLF